MFTLWTLNVACFIRSTYPYHEDVPFYSLPDMVTKIIGSFARDERAWIDALVHERNYAIS